MISARSASNTAIPLAAPGEAYALYVAGDGETTLVLDLPGGRYRLEWMDVLTGNAVRSGDLDHEDGRASLTSPTYDTDVALRIVARP